KTANSARNQRVIDICPPFDGLALSSRLRRHPGQRLICRNKVTAGREGERRTKETGHCRGAGARATSRGMGREHMNVQSKITADRAEIQRAARTQAYAMPLKDFHPGAPKLFATDTLWPYFERLRAEEPVHYCTNAPIEPYWSVTKYNDI